MYLDDHSGGNYYAKIEAGLNGIPLVVFESIPLPKDYQYPSNPYGGGIVGTANVIGAAYGGGLMGELQGALNIVNGVQDVGVGILNMSSFLSNPVMHVPIESWDWSRGIVTAESGTQGGWDDTHGWSKFIGGEAAVSLMTGGVSKLATAATEAGNCANRLSRWVLGGCFVAGTLVTLSDMPRSQAADDDVWSMDDPVWHGTPYRDSAPNSATKTLSQTATITSLLASPSRMMVPIEQVPLGARVPTKNPKPWEYDDSLPEPDQATWVKMSITVERTDGGIVDAELLRPRAWVESHGLKAGQLLPLNIAELQVAGLAHVTGIEPCPTISEGEGSVITARFLTRQVDVIVRVEIHGPDGTIEVLEGTPIHPIWSVDRNDWVPLGELEPNEQLLGQNGPATVLGLTLVNRPTTVFNIEVHGEHVYQVGVLGLLVHNAFPDCGTWVAVACSRPEVYRHTPDVWPVSVGTCFHS